MRESCSCGAFIQTARFSRVKEWRTGHRHTVEEVAPEPDKQGTIAITQRAMQFDHDTTPPVTARIGFSMEAKR